MISDGVKNRLLSDIKEKESDSSMEPSKLHMIMYFCLSPVFCFIVELVSYLAFLGLFAFVILRKFCIRITFFEYLLVIWMFSIQIERIRKFIAISNKSKREKFKMIIRDRWNLMYLLSMLTFVAGLILRGASLVSYQDIFEMNVKAFKGTERNINAYVSDNWTVFQEMTNFSSTASIMSNDNNPIYTALTDEAKDYVKANHDIYPFGFIRLALAVTLTLTLSLTKGCHVILQVGL